MTSVVYKSHHIDTDDDGHITVYECDPLTGSPDGDHWTEPTAAAARATIDLLSPVTIFGINEGQR
jgi:hypothetical protein